MSTLTKYNTFNSLKKSSSATLAIKNASQTADIESFISLIQKAKIS